MGKRADLLSELLARSIHGPLAAGAAGTLLLRACATFLGLVTGVMLARLLGAPGLGIYAFALALVGLLSIPASLGLNELAVREIAVYMAKSRWSRIRGIIRWANQVTALAGFSIALLAAGVAWLILGATQQYYAILLALTILPLSALSNLRQSAMRGIGKVILGQIPELLMRPLMMLVLITAIWYLLRNSVGVIMILGAAAIASAFAFGVGTRLLHASLPRAAKVAKPDYDVKAWLRTSWSFLVSSSLIVINSRADLILLGVLSDSASVGVYSVAVSVASLAGFVLAATNTSLSPRLAGLAISSNTEILERTMRRSSLAVLLFSLPVAVGIVVIGIPLLSVFGRGFTIGYIPLVILVMGQLANVSTGSVGQLLNMSGYERDVAFAVGVGVLVNVTLNLVLIPHIGLTGAAIATTASTIVWNVMLARYAFLRWTFVAIFGILLRRKTA